MSLQPNLMISLIPVVCCLKKFPCFLSRYFQLQMIQSDAHWWHRLSAPRPLTHDTWQVSTQNIFPLISIIRIFSVCPSFPFFWRGVPRTNEMHNTNSDITKQPRKLMTVFILCPRRHVTSLQSPVTGGGHQASHISRCPRCPYCPHWLYESYASAMSDVHN